MYLQVRFFDEELLHSSVTGGGRAVKKSMSRRLVRPTPSFDGLPCSPPAVEPVPPEDAETIPPAGARTAPRSGPCARPLYVSHGAWGGQVHSLVRSLPPPGLVITSALLPTTKAPLTRHSTLLSDDPTKDSRVLPSVRNNRGLKQSEQSTQERSKGFCCPSLPLPLISSAAVDRSLLASRPISTTALPGRTRTSPTDPEAQEATLVHTSWLGMKKYTRCEYPGTPAACDSCD